MPMTPDADCLRRFAETRAEAAFAEIVRRHTDFVYSVALRVTVNDALAQEVTQTVFTQMARQAGALCKYDTIAGWLHTTARHCAINAIRGEERRRAREHEATLMQTIATTPEVNWEQLRPILDEAVGQLREDDRKAVLLRYFNNLSHQEVGAVLGLSEDTARKRVERSLEKLRGYFAQRGVKATATILAAVISTNSVQAAPSGLAEKVGRVSLIGSGAAAGAGGAWLATFLYMSTKTKIIIIAAVLLALAATVTITWNNWQKPDTETSLTARFAPTSALPQTPAVAAPTAPLATVAKAGVTTLAAPAPAVASASAAAADTFVPGAKADLQEAILTGIHYLQNKDALDMFRTLMPPDAIAQEAQGGTLEQFVEHINQDANSAQKLDNMLQALNYLEEQNMTPAMNADQTRATFTFDAPVAGHKVVIFIKVDGLWYLNGM